MENRYVLFVDLDGVLVDFDSGVQAVTGKLPAGLHPKAMWPRLARTQDFYANLNWMSDGRDLWEYVESREPIILTGLPLGKWAKPQKEEWCRRELGSDVEVITCMSRNKPVEARTRAGDAATPILVDDRDKIREQWEAMGGVFIHHTNAASSIAALKEMGV